MRRFVLFIIVLALMSSGQRTAICPPGAIEGTVRKGRQLFTVASLVPLSNPAGLECGQSGPSWAESQLEATDVLIYVGSTVGMNGSSSLRVR